MYKAMLTSVGTSLERVKGIEPSYAAWEAAVLPLNYTREGPPLHRESGPLSSTAGSDH